MREEEYDTMNIKFLSTPSARRATPSATFSFTACSISIHALREEGDTAGTAAQTDGYYFYPRPPRGGRQLRPPGRPGLWDFYPRPPRGGRRAMPMMTQQDTGFLSTPSARRATQKYDQLYNEIFISIHALREEGDEPSTAASPLPEDFYPRPPRGGRPSRPPNTTRPTTFLSTPSARRATHSAPNRGGEGRNFYPRPPRGGRHSIPGLVDHH